MEPWPPGVVLAADLQGTVISRDMIAAYCATEYRVSADPPFTLRIGQPSFALQDVLCTCHRCSAAFMTAFNPCSEPATDAANAAAQARLVAELQRRECKVLPACGANPAARWAEPSVLALGLSRDEAIRLGREYRQNAIVWCDGEAVPELLLLR